MSTSWRVVQRLGFQLYQRRVTILFFALVLASLGTYTLWSRTTVAPQAAATPAGGQFPIEVAVEPLSLNQSSSNATPSDATRATLTLKEKNGSRQIAMNLDVIETLAIAQLQPASGAQIPAAQQTQAYNLLRSTINALGGKVDRIVVDGSTGSSYTAQIDVSTPDGEKAVSARPADAVALALSAHAPVYVDDAVLEKYGSSTSSTPPVSHT